ncbi:MAG TPA: hypothetical protein VIC35_05740 [Acidimicrobiia bacterium]|jgi:hypothetical protein
MNGTRARRNIVVLSLLAVAALAASACAPFTGNYTGPVTMTTASYRLGPFNLAAMNQPGWENESSTTNVPRPPGDVAIKTFKFDLVDSNGNPVDRMDVHLHHVLLMNAAHQSALCSGQEERFAGSGEERTPISLGGSYAYVSKSTDRWDALWHLMNMSDTAQAVYIQYTIQYVSVNDPAASRPVTPFFMDVTGCNSASIFQVPGNGGPGSVFTKSITYTAPWDGVAVSVGGHLHDGGIDISVKQDPSGPTGCTAVAKYDVPEPMDFPSSITSCVIHDYVHAGTQYTVTARYDNSMPHMDVMGIMLGYLWHGSPPSS